MNLRVLVKGLMIAGLVLLPAASTAHATPPAPGDITARDVTKALFLAAPGEAVDFTGRALRYLDLAAVDFKGARLAAADLYGVDLTGALLRGADLDGARLAGAIGIDRAVGLGAALNLDKARR
ncbi:MAG: pentapeptide repeat-containing protein [Hyphomicrobium sp.]